MSAPAPPLRTEPSTGSPAALSSLARMLWALHARPALHLVHDADADEQQPRDPVPALEQGPV